MRQEFLVEGGEHTRAMSGVCGLPAFAKAKCRRGRGRASRNMGRRAATSFELDTLCLAWSVRMLLAKGQVVIPKIIASY